MRRRITRIFAPALLAAAAVFMTALPVYAISNPDSTTMPSIGVFQNIFETGDMLFFCEELVEYDPTPEPSEPATATFLMSVYGTDGTTLTRSTPLIDYQTNIQSKYFSAAQVSAESLVWGASYVARVMGNPTYFSTLTEGVSKATVTLSSGQWYADGTQSSLMQLKTYCLDVAADLEDAWGVTLIVSTTDGNKLNSDGYTAFNDAIPGLNSALPSLFQMASSTYDIEYVESTGAYAATFTISGQLGTSTANAFTGIGEFLGISQQMTAALWIVLFMLIVASIVFLNSGNVGAAMVLTIPIAIIGVISGALPMAFLYTVAIVVVVYMGYFLWLRGM